MCIRDRCLSSEQCRRCCTFTGIVPQSDAPSYLSISDILISPHIPNKDGSRFFGSPTKLFEYMAMGKPIIASNLEQLGQILSPAIVFDNQNTISGNMESALGILCVPGNPTQILRAIDLLATDLDLRITLGSNARARVLADFTWEKHVDRILEKVGV